MSLTSRSLLLSLGSLLPNFAPGVVAKMTCGDVKDIFRSHACCGNPDQSIDLMEGSSGGVTRQMVLDAQDAWGQGIVDIAAAKVNGQDYEQVAHDHITNLYAYGTGSVLFKPTLAAERQFRSSFEGALSYFVASDGNGHQGKHAEDSGFAIKGWTKTQFYNDDIILSGNTAMAMGNYFFTNPEGKDVKVEYSFGYVLDGQGKLRINLHHSSLPYSDSSCDATAVTKEMVEAAQQAWGDGIVTIAAAKVNGQDYEQAAREHITNLYAYGGGHVLFKPTLAAEAQFRSSYEGALSYFVATNMHAPEDGGFAIKGWTAVRFENEEVIVSGNTAMAMGNYFFTTPDNTEVKVEYSFGYVLDSAGKLKINLHHSSLPYAVADNSACSGGVTQDMVTAAQTEWGQGIVDISSAYTAQPKGDYVQVAKDLVTKLYAYGKTSVLFKPTLAVEMQFRSTFEGALSYFVAQNGHAPEDGGFAIKGWTAVRFDTQETIIAGNTAVSMGNYFFTDPNGDEVKVEFSFGYVLDAEGQLRINLHHSSMPYSTP